MLPPSRVRRSTSVSTVTVCARGAARCLQASRWLAARRAWCRPAAQSARDMVGRRRHGAVARRAGRVVVALAGVAGAACSLPHSIHNKVATISQAKIRKARVWFIGQDDGHQAGRPGQRKARGIRREGVACVLDAGRRALCRPHPGDRATRRHAATATGTCCATRSASTFAAALRATSTYAPAGNARAAGGTARAARA